MSRRSRGPDKVRVVVEEIECRRRGEDRKKCSFSLCVCLVCENCPSYGYCRMLSLCLVRNIHSKATAVCHCVHLCVWLPVYVCIRALLLTCSGSINLCVCACVGPTDASLLLSLIRTGRHSGVKRWERNVSGNERKSVRERESKGVEEKHEVIRGTFTSSVPWPLSPSLSLALCLSLFLSLSHSPSCGLCLFIIFFSQWPFPPHSPGSLNKRRRAIVWQLWGLSYEFPHTYTHYTFLLSVRGHFLPNYQVLCT